MNAWTWLTHLLYRDSTKILVVSNHKHTVCSRFLRLFFLMCCFLFLHWSQGPTRYNTFLSNLRFVLSFLNSFRFSKRHWNQSQQFWSPATPNSSNMLMRSQISSDSYESYSEEARGFGVSLTWEQEIPEMTPRDAVCLTVYVFWLFHMQNWFEIGCYYILCIVHICILFN